MSKKPPVDYYNQFLLTLQKEKKKFKHKKFLWKAKIFLTIVLPIVIILLAVKTAQTWIHLKLKSISACCKQTEEHKDQAPD